MSSCNFEFLLTEGGRTSGPASPKHVFVTWELVVGGSWAEEVLEIDSMSPLMCCVQWAREDQNSEKVEMENLGQTSGLKG